MGAALTAAQATSDVTLETSPEIAAWLEASVGSTTLEKGHPAQIAFGLRALVSAAPGTYTGTIAVRSGSGAVAGSLPVTIHVRAATSNEVVAHVSDASVDRIGIGPTGQFMVKDEVIVGIDDAVADPGERIREIATDRGAVIMGSIPALRVYQLRIPSADESTIETHVDAIALLPGVDAASLGLLGGPLKTPDEGLFPAMDWTPVNVATGTNRHLEFIRAPAAWEVTTGGPIPVAVIDDGFDFGHPDLMPNIDTYGDVLKQILFTETYQDKPPPKLDGHGTEVAGTLCAESKGDGKGTGVVGVAWNCGLRLYDASRVSFNTTHKAYFTGYAQIVFKLCKAAGFTDDNCLNPARAIPRT